VTRSGTNEWHGDVFDFFRNDALDANNWFNNHTIPETPKTAERQNDFGGALGGPIRLPYLYNGYGSTFFFASYEGLRLQSPTPALTTQVPSLALREASPAAVVAALNAFPLPNGADLGNGLASYTAAYSTPSMIDTGTLRLDHQVGNKLRLFLRYGDSSSSATARAGNNCSGCDSGDLAQLVEADSTVQTTTAGATLLLSEQVTSDARFNYTRNTTSSTNSLDSFGSAIPYDPSSLDLPPYSGLFLTLDFGGFPTWQVGRNQNSQGQMNFVETLAVLKRSHLIKTGVDYRRIETRTRPYSLIEEPVFFTQQQLISNQVGFGLVSSQTELPVEPIYTNASAFFQDEWTIHPRLSLSLGVRWELNPPPGDAFGNVPYTVTQIGDLATTSLAPKGTPLWKTTYHNIAPRFGVAYKIVDKPERELVLRGGVGVFYSTGNTYASQGLGGIGYGSYQFYSGVSFPFTAEELQLPPPSVASPYSDSIYAFDSNLSLPYTTQWNLAAEQSVGTSQSFMLNYVASSGRRLLFDSFYNLASINQNFASGYGLYLTTNGGKSNYESLQVRFQRQISRGLQALLSYTWSHDLDNVSANSGVYELIYGNSDFDIRHNLEGAAVYSPNIPTSSRTAKALLQGWQITTRLQARSSLPIDIYSGIQVTESGQEQFVRADVVQSEPIYRNSPSAPGRRIVNFAAFAPPANGAYGNEPRNFVRAYDAIQDDIGLQREFGLSNHLMMLIRVEAFNALNHPIFGTVQNDLSYGPGYFGFAQNTLNAQLGGLNPLYQVGGPRSLQAAMKLHF
jgi:hypothetical protein